MNTDTDTTDETPPGDPVTEHRAATRTNSIRPTPTDDPDDPVAASRDARRRGGNLT